MARSAILQRCRQPDIGERTVGERTVGERPPRVPRGTLKRSAAEIDYIHASPVGRGLVERPEDWPWASCRDRGTGRAGIIPLDTESCEALLSQLPTNFT